MNSRRMFKRSELWKRISLGAPQTEKADGTSGEATQRVPGLLVRNPETSKSEKNTKREERSSSGSSGSIRSSHDDSGPSHLPEPLVPTKAVISPGRDSRDSSHMESPGIEGDMLPQRIGVLPAGGHPLCKRVGRHPMSIQLHHLPCQYVPFDPSVGIP